MTVNQYLNLKILTHQTIRWVLVAFFCLATFSMQAQRKGFVSTIDNLYQQGRITYDKGDPRNVKLNITESETIQYGPKDLKRFGYLRFLGFGDSTIYESANIPIGGQNEDLFLRQLVGGKQGLLEYEGSEPRFFYRHDQGITELTKSNYREVLGKVVDGKPFWVFQTAKIRFNRTHLTLFFQAVNFGARTQINFPRLQLQASAINGNLTIKGLNDSNSPLIDSPMSLEEFGVGISYYQPVTKSTKFGFTMGLSYEQYDVVATRPTNNGDKDLLTEFDRFVFEIAPTYKLALGRIVPSLFAGPSLALSTNQSSLLLEATRANELVTLFTVDTPVEQPKIHTGFTMGINLDFLITPVITTSLGYSYNISALNAMDFKSISTTKITFKIGL